MSQPWARSEAMLVLLVWGWVAGGPGAWGRVYRLRLAVDEGLPAGTLVGAIGAGLPPGRRWAAGGFLLSEAPPDLRVEAGTGLIRTARRLDRERRARYAFAAATRRGAVVRVAIAVKDVNDHPPRFPRPAVALRVSEGCPPGTAFRLPAARDPDAGLFSTQGYALLSPGDGPLRSPGNATFRLPGNATLPSPGNAPLRLPGNAPGLDPSPFRLRYAGPEPLELVLARGLDREAAAGHRLLIEAWDGGRPRRSGRLRVHVRVLDENDNPPVFERGHYLAAVREDAPPGTAVCRVRATDRDRGPNGRVRYRLRPGPAGPFFSVGARSGLVRLRRPLDREARARHRLLVEARDGGAPPEAAGAAVAVAVLDVNDNRPAIRLLFLTEGGGARVSEGARPGDYVARVSVADADEGAGGGPGRLALEGGGGAFALWPGAGPGVFFLRVAAPLDRERRDRYELRLVATDGGVPPLRARRRLALRVTDLNDQPPRFGRAAYGAAVSEAAAPGTAVLRLRATDADQPGTAQASLRYALLPGPGPSGPSGPDVSVPFAIEPSSGLVRTTRALDREAQPLVELWVVARDLGEPPLSATCRVRVALRDVNDNEPRFQRRRYAASLPEHAPPGHCFLQVNATDADAGQYGRIEYFLYDGYHNYEKSQAFQIDPHTGHVCVSQDIDRESDPVTYDLLVKAKDGGGLSAQAFVHVEVEDVNDNQPVFNPTSYVTSISGHTQPGSEILNVIARDKDSGVYGTVTYELVPGELSSLFTIDSSTGIIYLVSVLQHLESTSVSLTVSARDGGGLSSAINADVIINILPTALAPAVFERSEYIFSVPEDIPEGSLVGTVKAREPLNSLETISYRISSGDPSRSFSIDPQFGVLRTRRQLDYETQSLIVLTVQSQLGNSPIYSSTQVNVNIIDINDNSPVFLLESDNVTILQSTLPGSAFYIARAEDRDSGLNGLIQYTITSQTPNIFTIDSRLGIVYLNGTPPENTQHKSTLCIVAKDLGMPPLKSLLTLTVIVEKQDFISALTFENLVYEIEVSEYLSPAAQVLQVQAYLLVPHPAASQIVYSLEPSPGSAAFSINPYTGEIYLRRQLDYESIKIHSFRAFAHGLNHRAGQNTSTSVTVHVLDENDNSPAFLQEAYFWKVEESPVPRGVIGIIAATDIDSGRNGQLSYFLLSDGKYFKMNPSTGEIINWFSLDHEHQAHHQLSVLVIDHGNPSHNATVMAYISVTDLNDNKPQFPQFPPENEISIKVLEGQPADVFVTTVFAKDPDAGNNGEVSYSISSEESLNHFKMDVNSGEIRTTTILSYNHQPNYRMTITARDQGIPPLQGYVVINIQVIPLSKERSLSSQHIRNVVLPENFKPGQVMNLIKSFENLQKHESKIHFSIAEEDRDGYFEVESSSGDLFLLKQLDYEVTSHYLLRVIMKDHNQNPPLNSMLFLSIDVEDQNDHSPSFKDDFIVISVEENVPVGTLVYTFNAKDGDGSFLNSKIQYFIEAKSLSENPFLIHPSLGTLVTATPLDREVLQSVVLVVTASDQAVNVTDRRVRALAARILILDVNDNSPDFASAPVVNIPEETEAGSLVHRVVAKDPDEGRNGKVTYHLLSGNEKETFMLDRTSGLLTTTCPLDYETQKYYILTVLALDDGLPALSVTQTLTVTVLDINDEAPVFKKLSYEATVPENQGPGQLVTKVEALDRDSGINSELQFEILPGAFFGLFQVNSKTGEVVTATSFDREVRETFTLRVLVQDGGIPPLSSTTTILCTVEDENDHAPRFILPIPEIRVPENQEPEIIYTILAKDMDSGNNGAIQYEIIGGNTEEYFTLNHTSGELSPSRSLDREDVSNFTLIIEGRDLGNPPRSSSTQIQVTILDDNDHSPAFPFPHYHISVREDLEVDSVILTLSATDEDEGLNRQIMYSLCDADAFTIDSVTGTLKVTKSLDRETKSQYFFRVMASDCSIQGPRSTVVNVTVQVEDVNDNNPVFEQNPLNAFVSLEMALNQTIAIVKATDADLGLGGSVEFSFAEADPRFHIDGHSGEVRLQKFQALESFPIWLLVKAEDRGDPARASMCFLVIHMEDQEMGISFSRSLYEGTVTENCEAGTSVVTVEASALNSRGTALTYWILSGNEDGAFFLDTNTGELTVKEPMFLDFEVRNEIHLLVLAENHQHRAHCKVTVLVQDMNDNVPSFEQSSYQASVWEGQLYNAYVMQVFASDMDSGLNGQIEYSILSGNLNDTFQIDSKSGVITTNAILDYNLATSNRLVIQATDKGLPRLSGTSVVVIQVVDINNNAPVFLPSDPVKVAENASPSYIVTQVSAYDGDLSPALAFSFTKEGNPGTKFAIDPVTGKIMLVKPLDFEETAEYELQIQASDSVHHTETAVRVHVLDVNDNPPEFIQDSYQVTIPELTPVGSFVLAVSATDRDLGRSGVISYKIISSCEEFSIDLKNGSIFTAKTDMHLEKKSFQCLIEARDNGIPALTAITLVIIDIKDVNNYAPVFTAAHYNFSVSEDAVIGSLLATFSAIDHDWTRENTDVDYSIFHGNTQNQFLVETRTVQSEYSFKKVGHLVLSRTLDRETAPSHRLVILASDCGHPPLTATATVVISVLDTNDNPPVFRTPEHHVHIRENILPGSPIAVISANDCDSGPNGEVTYTLISGNEKGHFHLDEKTGAVDLIKSLDYEETTKFTLTLQASDEGSKNVAFSVIFVSVLDDNDHAPQFVLPILKSVVYENLPSFFTVCTINALDFDTGPYGHLTYSIQSSCMQDPGVPHDHEMFSIDPLTGEVRARQILDYESQSHYCFVVQAKDKGASTATLTVQVDIEGADEFEPVFTQDEYHFHLPQVTEIGHIVGKVAASDADAGEDGIVLYFLDVPSQFFSVNETNGNIYVTGLLPLRKTLKKDETIELIVLAHSPKPNSKSTTCKILVNVPSSPESYWTMTANSLSISLMISSVVFLLLTISFIALIWRFRQKYVTNSRAKKRAPSPPAIDSSLTVDINGPKGPQKFRERNNSLLPLGSASEWMSLVDTRETKHLSNPCRHSSSSGHGSTEGETTADEEIKTINGHPCRKGASSVLSERGSRVPDSGIPRDSDWFSCQSEEMDVVRTTDTVESVRAFRGDGEDCTTNSSCSRGLKEKYILVDGRRDCLFIPRVQDARDGTLAMVVASDEDLRGSYNWDYLLSWEPRFQPLASVFGDIAKLEDEHLQVPGFLKEKKSFIFPAPLITSVAQPDIRAVPPHMPTLTLGKTFQKYPRSPLVQHRDYLLSAMTPSFSPSVSLLTMQTPTASPILPDMSLFGAHSSGSSHGPET
ncbi:protocadherin-23 [Tachyglossus aculeatus]|uniref:protocadherin-23 n=1 Tax=Tachyglossus aculeatus TaxID=9261 RepID=UPI0018F51D99|nr:protocadherin-23 [Tachyglossus aculeatus]